MSSDQYANRPMPSGKHCPHCGADMPANSSECWLCREKLAIREGAPSPIARRESSYLIEERAWTGDNVAWMMLGVLAIVLCVSIAFAAPGFLLLLLVLATPALIRAGIAGFRDERAVASGPSFVMVFLSSLGIAAIVGLASYAAFFATCLAVCLGGLALDGSLRNPDLLMVASVGGGLVPGIAVAVLLFRRLYRFK